MRPRPIFCCLLLALALAACGGSQPPASTTARATASGGEASARLGELGVRASAVQTSMLDAGVARAYGIERDPRTILLLVTVRRGADADAGAAPAQLDATVTDLRGSRQDIALRAVRVDGLTDYIGTVTTSLPDTLRFDVRVVADGGATARLQLSRDFYP